MPCGVPFVMYYRTCPLHAVRTDLTATGFTVTTVPLTALGRREDGSLTPDGLKFAIFYTKVHEPRPAPLMASDQPQAPPPLRQARRTMDAEVRRRLDAARLPAAA